MAKVFRLHKEANNNIVDWAGGTHLKYGVDVTNQIEDPQGATSKKEITSIPSPFARIDLAKSAFKAIGERPDKVLEGNTIYHKIISDCLDIGEIFFNYEKLADKIEIIVWDRDEQINTLLNSENQAHRILGQTLKMYLEQDGDTYNFAEMSRLYLLRYKGKERKSQMDIIGSTSPCTLFFSSANDLRYLAKDLKASGNDLPFDDDYSPLYKRDFEYQKYLYSLKASTGNQIFSSKFPEISAYLRANYSHLSSEQKTIIDELENKPNCIDVFPKLSINSDTVEVLNIPLRRSKGVISSEVEHSDFRIASTIYQNEPPLVLPVKPGNEYTSLKYIQANWDKTYKAPYYDSLSFSQRTLPYMSDKYPYLTISDFLTPSIMSMPYELSDSFFNGNVSDKSTTFLLPIKPLFFKFFTVDELRGVMNDGKNMIEMTSGAGGAVNVILRIPIQGGRYITYERMYFKDHQNVTEKNEGSVVEQKFGLGVMPLIQSNNISPYYRVAFFPKKKDSKLTFASNTACEPKDIVQRSEPTAVCGVVSYVIEESFDKIYVTINGTTNVILPKFIKTGNSSQYTFAVDFGTTNTHIEYSIDGSSSSRPFDIKHAEQQMQRMHKDYKQDKDIQYAFEHAFIPDTIADSDDYSFPIRTALAEHVNIDYKQQANSMANGNIPFRYEKAAIPSYNKVKTDIKWSNSVAARVEMYLDNLFLLMRNKVLLNGGDITSTKVIWFYPVSMTKARCDKFAEIWNKLYKKYFGDTVETNLIMMSESVAPYNYYKQKKGAKSNVVTIDIGGGTTDVYVVEDNEPKMLSSFRFAANAIFGDGYNHSADSNGFVNTFKEGIISILKSNEDKGLSDVLKAFEEIEKSEKSNDIIAYFFSLANNKIIKDKSIPLNFIDMLSKNDKYKYVFIIFYGAVLYYVARMMKAKGLSMPQTLAFSGNGSKTLCVLSNNKSTLSMFASLIFENVYSQEYSDTKLDIIFDNEPKLATCKGGIAHKSNLSFEGIESIKTSLLGIDGQTFTDNIKYKDIDNDNTIKAVAQNVSEFIDFLFSIHDNNKQFFVKYLAADAQIIEKIKKLCKSELIEYTKQGVEKKMEELQSWGAGEDTEVEETMFFYPIVAMLNNIAREIINY